MEKRLRCPRCGQTLVDVRWVGPVPEVPVRRLVGDCEACDEVFDVTPNSLVP